MDSSFLELIELDNGDVVLKRFGEDGEPLLSIRFSDEAVSTLGLDLFGPNHLEIARAMVMAGLQAASSERVPSADEVQDEPDGSGGTLH